MQLFIRVFVLTTLLFMLAACGGSDSNDTKQVSVSFDRTTVQFNGSMSNESYHQLGFTLQNLPDAGLYIKQVSSNNAALYFSDADLISDTRGVIHMSFKEGIAGFGPGVVTGSMQVAFCYDATCNKQIAGSPVNLNISINYAESALLNYPRTLSFTKAELEANNKTELTLEFQNPNKDQIYLRIQKTGDGPLSSAAAAMLASGNIQLDMYFDNHYSRFGLLQNTLTFKACYDSSCTKPITNAEGTVVVSVDNRVVDAAADPISIVQQQALPFDILHSKFIPARNAVAITSSWPEDALYLLSLTDFSHQKVSLVKAATSIAVFEHEVVVGHDALLTHINFATAQPQISLLNVPVEVFDVALTSNAVHFTEASTNWSDLLSIDLASKTLRRSVNGSINGSSKLAAHPTQPWVYAANRGLSPDEIDKFDVSTTPSTQLYDSPYHGDYAFCSNLWIAEDGARVYTPCGNTFHLSANREIDLTYSGKFSLSENFRVRSLADNPGDNEFILVEHGPFTCEWNWGNEPCLTRISSYNREFLNNRQLRSIPMLSVNEDYYMQEALAVFYNQDKTKRFMLSRLADMPSMADMFYISEITF